MHSLLIILGIHILNVFFNIKMFHPKTQTEIGISRLTKLNQ